MELLGSSQTFLGFLGALLVLCILMNEGNFILKIVDKVKDDIKNKIITLDNKNNLQEYYLKLVAKKQSDLRFDMLLNNPDNLKNHIIGRFPEKECEIINKIDALVANARMLKMRSDAVFANTKCKSSLQLLKETKPLEDKLRYSSEQCLAPLYVLLLCFVVFIFDEASRLSVSSFDFCVSCLVLLMIFSILFWIGIWGRFGYIFLKELSVQGEVYEKYCLRDLNLSKCLTRLLLCIFLAYIFIVLTNMNWIHVGENMKLFIFYIIGFGLPILSLPICFLKRHRSFGNYSYPFILNHFMGFTSLSITYTLILFGISYLLGDGYNCLINYNRDIVWLKMLLFVFVIFNGIMMPFFSQIWASNQIKELIYSKIKTIHKQLHKECYEMERQLDRIQDDVNKLNSGDF